MAGRVTANQQHHFHHPRHLHWARHFWSHGMRTFLILNAGHGTHEKRKPKQPRLPRPPQQPQPRRQQGGFGTFLGVLRDTYQREYDRRRSRWL